MNVLSIATASPEPCRSLIACAWLLALLGASAAAQEESESTVPAVADLGLVNGSMEQVTDGRPDGWFFPANNDTTQHEYRIDSENPFVGQQSMLVDTTNHSEGARFAVFNQSLPAEALRGKRVRFRAAVRTADRSDGGRAQLWFRIDRESGAMGGFDNMQDRPIEADDWQHYDIVLDVEEDAKRVFLGMLVLGKTKAWMDDASLEVVDQTVKKTDSGINASAAAPPQPFYSHWLWLAALVMFLMFVAHGKNSFWQRFALHFSCAYWLFYSFPSPFRRVISRLLGALAKVGLPTEATATWIDELSLKYAEQTERLTGWFANNVLGIEAELTSAMRNGSGDTTMAYVRLFVGFCFALVVAAIWSGILRRRDEDQTWVRDLLRTYLRYVLALSMLGYGLAKAGFISTQFAPTGLPGEFQLNRTYGDSSPMGLLWTFMAVSPMYTFLAGLGEVVAGWLLVFRRTATLGAIVAFGVMLNVVMLNFCYDVPVKQYSFHLAFMALMIAMPDMPRLLDVLVFHRSTTASAQLSPPYVGQQSRWYYWTAKVIVLFCAIVLPTYQHVSNEVRHEHEPRAESEHLLLNRGYRWVNERPFNR